MHKFSTRRDFLRASTVTALGLSAGAFAARAIEPIPRQGAPRLMLSLAAYSFRNFFRYTNDKKPSTEFRSIELSDFVNFCGEHNCAAEVTSYYFPKQITDEFLLNLKRHAFLRGVPISGSAVGNTFALKPGPERDKQIADTKKWIDHAALLSAPHIRIFAGNATKDATKEEAKKLCIEAIEECCDYAGKRGVVLGLENHGGIVAEPADLLEIVRAVKSPWFGINLDTGNFHTDDPYADLAACAPYAVNVQVKGVIRRRGQKTDEPSDLKRVAKLLRDANYQGYVALEYEMAEDPWKAVPRLLEELRTAITG
ncbi:MAG TPA: sugar phosphate isomerase/epimerase family protein [Candidatus Acidoferrum sp.]|nr:sugar phosphate isomerase/epimerase family protein [Candidatus Acidoferrum sp.]